MALVFALTAFLMRSTGSAKVGASDLTITGVAPTPAIKFKYEGKNGATTIISSDLVLMIDLNDKKAPCRHETVI